MRKFKWMYPAIALLAIIVSTDSVAHGRSSPLEFMQRLAALVPRPRLNLIRFASFRFAKYLLTPFHGVLAPNAQTAR